MKLAELNTEQSINVICELEPFIMEVVGDKEFMSTLLDKYTLTGKETEEEKKEIGFDIVIKKIKTLLPSLLKTHRGAIYGIISVLAEKDIKEIENQSLILTMKDINEHIIKNFKELSDVFTQLF